MVTFYHITPLVNAKSILDSGLKTPPNPQGFEDAIYLTNNPSASSALLFGEEEGQSYAVFEVNLPDYITVTHNEDFYDGVGEYLVHQDIPPQFLNLLGVYNEGIDDWIEPVSPGRNRLHSQALLSRVEQWSPPQVEYIIPPQDSRLSVMLSLNKESKSKPGIREDTQLSHSVLDKALLDLREKDYVRTMGNRFLLSNKGIAYLDDL